MRKAQQLQSMQKVQQLRIAGLCCDLVLPGDYERGQMRYPVLYVNGEIPAQEILAELKRAGGRTDFILLCVRPDSWNDDFTPETRRRRRAGRRHISPGWRERSNHIWICITGRNQSRSMRRWRAILLVV